MSLSMENLDWSSIIDTYKPSLWIALGAITFNPTAWNIVARNEYRNKTITRMFGGNARYGCYFLAVMIFSFGLLRDSIYHNALSEQPKMALLPEPYATVVPAVLIGLGQLFVITSTWALGITGTFLGDYFGILMDHRVEGFPFNVLRDPMYVGSTMTFVGGALWYERPAGLIVALYVYIVYMIALRYEGPFTDMIYSTRANAQNSASKKEL
ncbi:Phosphatidyl-N-methylethanolamine N-methyltransferase [Paramarasmius palmivorus]|uniref:Phosphatidyl-N-methylethanolamine N-methyltransferase n=1 Tax=Paramarasmius palmivorus TaxID=297713 RepID=A0AAW0D4R2_9AGAR